MALPTKFLALIGSGIVAASAAAAYVALGGAVQRPGEPAAARERVDDRAAPDGEDEQTICVGPDRVLRAFFTGVCPANHVVLALEEADERLCDLCDPDDRTDGRAQGDDGRLGDIERRISQLERGAYFVVVTGEDRNVFAVGPGLARLYFADAPVAGIGYSDDGGYFTGRSTSGAGDVSIAASGANAGLRFKEIDLPRVTLGVQGSRAGLLFDAPRSVLAGIGESGNGSGAMLVGTLLGDVKSAFTAGARGRVTVDSLTDEGGVVITEASIGGGLLDIANARGDSVVKMGHNGNRYGIVLAGPVLGMPLIPRTGLPGSYFMGCQSGEKPACVPNIP